MKRNLLSLIVLISMLLGMVSSAAAKPLLTSSITGQTNPSSDTAVVVRVYFTSREELDALASRYDILTVDQEQGFVFILVSPSEYASLQQAGFRVEIDEAKTELINLPHIALPGQGSDSIPGFPCYRTVEETYTSMDEIITGHPDMAQLIEIGASWTRYRYGFPNGFAIKALRLTNESFGVIAEKPTFFLMAEIHAREYVTAEAAMRFAEYLLDNYEIDPDITWLLDYFRIYIVTMTNPDGRKLAESGNYWRKNVDNDDGCTDPDSWGTDLNRNHSFKWGLDDYGSSPYPCDETYRGPSGASEPETRAIQNYVRTLFADQRGPLDTDPAPIETTGILISLHSAYPLVLWPWGWTSNPAPNNNQLQTLGRHLAFFNHYPPQQSNDLYTTNGTSDDWSYGELGIASYTFEMGTEFFQDCSSFENSIYPDNRDALMYAFKAARRPYMNPAGPDSLSLVVSPNNILAGTPVQLTAIASGTRYYGGGTPQVITGAHFSIDLPSWITETVTYPMTASDGAFNNSTEGIQGLIDTSGMSEGRHIIFVESSDSDNWGVTSAIFLNIVAPPEAEFTSSSPIPQRQPMAFTNQTTGTEPITYKWNFGDGQGTSTDQNPTYTYEDTGIFTVTLVATNTLGTDNISHAVTILPAIIDSVDLTKVTIDPISPGGLVDLSADILPDDAGKPYSYTIDFDDGMIVTGTSSLDPYYFDHIFTTTGSYAVQIWVVNASMVEPVTEVIDIIVEHKVFLPLSIK